MKNMVLVGPPRKRENSSPFSKIVIVIKGPHVSLSRFLLHDLARPILRSIVYNNDLLVNVHTFAIVVVQRKTGRHHHLHDTYTPEDLAQGGCFVVNRDYDR